MRNAVHLLSDKLFSIKIMISIQRPYQKPNQDGAEPASNSVAASNLLRLSSFLDKPDCKEKAMKIFEAFSERLAKIPMALPEMASALVFNPSQIIITGASE